MSEFDLADSVTISAGPGDGDALVVLLHGRGGAARDMITIAGQLPAGPEYVSLQGPIPDGGGWCWFTNSGIGNPEPASLNQTVKWFTRWLDGVSGGRDVILVGYSGGATFAGALVLDEPTRYVGAVLVNGLIPMGDASTATPGRLGGLTMLVANGAGDRVVPQELVASTWDYLNGASAAPTIAYRTQGGHGFPTELISDIGTWIARRFAFVDQRRHEIIDPDTNANLWAEFPDGRLPRRSGSRPAVSTRIPQEQLDQNAPPSLQESVFSFAAGLAGVATRPSVISVPGARAFMLDGCEACGPQESFIVASVGEFAHLHPAYDGSMHMTLPAEVAVEVVASGWGAAHPMSGTQLPAGMIMVFGPRDHVELEIIQTLLTRSHRFASQPDRLDRHPYRHRGSQAVLRAQ